MTKKMTHKDFIYRVNEVLGEEYTVLSQYNGQSEPVDIMHVCGHVRSVKPREILRTKKLPDGTRIPNPTKCPYCYGNKSHTIDEFKKVIEEANKKENLELEVLGTEYKGNKVGIKTICHKCNKIFYPSWNSFVNKSNRCPCNTNAIIPVNKKMSIDEFKNIVYSIDKEYIVLSDNLESYYSPVKIKHIKCGSEYYISPDAFINGKRRCRHCINNDKKVSLEDFKNMVYNQEADNYTVLQTFEPKNNKEPILIRHNCETCNNHEFKISIVNFNNNHRCPICAYKQDSKGERELREFIESLVECYEKEYSRCILDGKEIDILTTSNIGFEYNGEYWHQEVEKPVNNWDKPIGYHKNKTISAKEKNITLYHIWENQWKNNKDKVKEFIRKALGVDNNEKD